MSNVKGITKYDLVVLIEKNKYTNEKKLIAEIQKLLTKNTKLREVNLVQFKKTKQIPPNIRHFVPFYAILHHYAQKDFNKVKTETNLIFL